MELPIDNIQLEQTIKYLTYGGEIIVLLIMIIYLIFAFVFIRRLKIMNLNLQTPHNKLFSQIAKLRFAVAFVVVILTFFSL